jgi:hypothetical protein
MIRFRPIKNRKTDEKMKIFGPAIMITIIGFFVAYHFVAPGYPLLK